MESPHSGEWMHIFMHISMLNCKFESLIRLLTYLRMSIVVIVVWYCFRRSGCETSWNVESRASHVPPLLIGKRHGGVIHIFPGFTPASLLLSAIDSLSENAKISCRTHFLPHPIRQVEVTTRESEEYNTVSRS